MATKLDFESARVESAKPAIELLDKLPHELIGERRSVRSLPSSVMVRVLTFHPKIDHFKALELIKSISTEGEPIRLWQTF